MTPSTSAAMSVLLETSSGDIVIDLLVDYAPKLCEKYAASPSRAGLRMLS